MPTIAGGADARVTIRYFTHPDGIRVFPSGELIPSRHLWLYPFAMPIDPWEALAYSDVDSA